MIQVAGLILIIAIVIFLYLKNKQENRAIDRRNRLAEKQDELIEMLKNKKDTNDDY
jgi:cbb3-type cytochrome oxidase subunit 3